PTPTPTNSAEPKPSDSPEASPSADPATAKLQEEFTKLNCADPEQRAAAGKDALPTDSIVACGSNVPGSYEKYILGPAEVSGGDVD
ncbi:protein translocase subunit SecD, partial [Streptomyces cyaneofuscatus]